MYRLWDFNHFHHFWALNVVVNLFAAFESIHDRHVDVKQNHIEVASCACDYYVECFEPIVGWLDNKVVLKHFYEHAEQRIIIVYHEDVRLQYHHLLRNVFLDIFQNYTVDNPLFVFLKLHRVTVVRIWVQICVLVSFLLSSTVCKDMIELFFEEKRFFVKNARCFEVYCKYRPFVELAAYRYLASHLLD